MYLVLVVTPSMTRHYGRLAHRPFSVYPYGVPKQIRLDGLRLRLYLVLYGNPVLLVLQQGITPGLALLSIRT